VLEHFYASNELIQLWNVEIKVHEEVNVDIVKCGGIDSRDEVFQVLADALE